METLIENPLAEVASILEKCQHDAQLGRDAVLEFFCSKLDFSTNDLLKIPSLNEPGRNDLQTGTLVRFRGMIQDIYDPEYFVPSFRKGSETITSLFRDPLETEVGYFSNESKSLMERSTWHCIAIPGESPWVMESYSKSAVNDVEVPTKRRKSEGMEVEPASANADAERPWCFPLDSHQTSCIVKSYLTNDEMRLNDMVDIVGILSHVPESNASSDEPGAGEINFKNPPTSRVPRIHAVFCKKIQHVNPLLGRDITVESSIHRRRALDEAKKNHLELLDIFSRIFHGDEHCAEYLLMHIISRVYLRHDVLALGKFSLNLRNIGRDQAEALAEILSLLVTKCHVVSMSLEYLNKAKFVPNKDYELNRLQSGLLQLSPGTILICDENAMNAGQLSSVGIENLKALGNMIQNQSLEYNFGFQRVEFHTDVPVLYISQGKGLVQCDFQSKMRPTQPKADMTRIVHEIEEHLTDEVLTRLRRYITVLKCEEHQLSSEMQQKVQNDFVSMRAENSNMTADDLHSLLVVARYVSLLNGQIELTPECWEHAKALEAERRYRCT